MKRVLIISFDLIRPGEVNTTLSIGTILSYLQNQEGYGSEFDAEHIPINMLDPDFGDSSVHSLLGEKELNNFSYIAISCFVWNEMHIRPLIRFIKSTGYQGKIVLGGSQITYANREQLQTEYPGADIFISGYAEESMFNLLRGDTTNKSFYCSTPEFGEIPSPYLTGAVRIREGQEMIRWETKRGCTFRCSFCAHRNLENGKVHYMHWEKAFSELELFKRMKVRKVNVLDPIFNMGPEYMQVLKEIDRMNFNQTSFSLQTKVELLSKNDGSEFLNLVERNNIHLEFGIQTLIEKEYKGIKRANNVDVITKHLEDLNQRGISHETSLIYGLPNQTFDSFRRSVDLLTNSGCTKIVAWPLMLLKGTQLYEEKDKWNLSEEVLGDFGIPVVTSSNSYDRQEWEKMNEFAKELNAGMQLKRIA